MQSPVRHLECPAVAIEAARPQHLETFCVPPELEVVAKLSHGFALSLSDITQYLALDCLIIVVRKLKLINQKLYMQTSPQM